VPTEPPEPLYAHRKQGDPPPYSEHSCYYENGVVVLRKEVQELKYRLERQDDDLQELQMLGKRVDLTRESQRLNARLDQERLKRKHTELARWAAGVAQGDPF